MALFYKVSRDQLKVVIFYMPTLYGEKQGCGNSLPTLLDKEDIDNLVLEEENLELIKLLSREDIQEEIWAFDYDKAMGPYFYSFLQEMLECHQV